jgi:hypothetical protein
MQAGFGTSGSGEAPTAPTREKSSIELPESSAFKRTLFAYAKAIPV